MNNKIYKLVMVATCGILISSCSKEYLNYEPVAAENSGSFYLTMSHAEQATTAAYATLSNLTTWDRDLGLAFGDITSNDAEAGGDFENEVPGMEVYNRFTHLPTEGILDAVYGDLFRGVYLSNLGLEKIPNIINTDPDAKPDIINKRLAELKFLRALNYLYLVNVFGEVPLADHVLLPSEYYQEKTSIRVLYDFIEQNLLEAIPVLPEKSQLSSNEVGRATKGAAKALLARLYLFESSYAKNYPGDARFAGLNQRWDDVLRVSEEIINSGEYSLIGYTGEKFNTWRGPQTNGYQYLFTVKGENCSESIFDVQYINDGVDYVLTRAGSLVQWTSPRYYVNSSGTGVQSGYWGLGWPTQSLVDQYDPNDIRLHATVSMPGDSVQIAGGRTLPVFYGQSATGYYLKKYELPADEFADAGGHSWHKSPFNYKIVRYADVVLMASEAAIMLGDNGKATTYINMIRTRARNCGTTGVPADLTGTITLDQLIAERRMELSFEGRRFFDMVRWNIAKSTLDGTETPGGFPIVYESPKNDFMPLPQREITVNNGVLTQHEGW